MYLPLVTSNKPFTDSFLLNKPNPRQNCVLGNLWNEEMPYEVQFVYTKALRLKKTRFDQGSFRSLPMLTSIKHVTFSPEIKYITLSHFTQRYTVCMYSVPFYITLSHFTQRYTGCMYAVPFYISLRTLCYSTLLWAISSNATPFGMCAVLIDIALSHFTQRYTVCVYTVPFDITLSYLTQRYTVCVLYCKWVLSYSQMSQSISQFHVPTRHRQLDRLSFG